MLNKIVQLSLRHRHIVLCLAILTLIYGGYVCTQVKLDVFPEFVQPQVDIQTEAPGLAAEQVETLVTRLVESEINGAVGIESVRSESIQGLSVITVVFKDGADIYKSRQSLSERLGEIAGELPAGVKTPKMSALTSSTMDLLKIGLLSDRLSPMELRAFADWTLRPRLLSVPGVARTTVFGGEVRQLQIQVREERLRQFGISLQEVLAAARSATAVRGAGYVENSGQRIILQSEGQAITPESLSQVVVRRRDNQTIRFKDVADVVEAAQPRFGDALIMGRPGILVTMASQFQANTIEATLEVEKALDEMKPVFASQGITLYGKLHRPASFIETALSNVRLSLLHGGLLVAIVLFLFLLDWKITLISFISIPLSLLATTIVLFWCGQTVNTMTLGGFAVAIGVVVDDAIIDVENIVRRLRLSRAIIPAPNPFKVILDASVEVRHAVVYATFVVALVFVPVLSMSGVQGRFFYPLGIAFILSITVSLLVAMTVTPVLSSFLLGRRRLPQEPPYVRGLKRLHLFVLDLVSKFFWPAAIGAVALFAGAILLWRSFGNEYLPAFRESHFVIQVTEAPGTSLAETLRLGEKISAEFLSDTQRIASVEEQIGRAEMGEDTWGTHRSEFHVELKPVSGSEGAAVQEELRQALKKFPGIQAEVLTFLGDRISETLSGETASVVVNIFGDDLDVLDDQARRVRDILQATKGSTEVQIQSPPGIPQLSIRLDQSRLTQFGFVPSDVLDTIETAYQGTVVSQVYDQGRVYDVNVMLHPSERVDPESVADLLVSNGQGLQMPLKTVAEIGLTTGRYSVSHEGARRRQTVTCNVKDRDVGSFVLEAKAAIAKKITLPRGVYITYGGTAEESDRARAELVLHSLLTAVGVVLLLSLVFSTGRNLLLVLANLPFALVGGVLAIYLQGRLTGLEAGTLSLGGLVGFVTLFGITTRNSIMMISHLDHLVNAEGAPWSLETTRQAASERLLPILMTALVTGLGLLPLALGSGEAGREIEGPMAIVILGGLVTSTTLNLLLLPVMAWRYGRFNPDKAVTEI